MPETVWSSTRAKDVGPTRRSPRANSTFYILRHGLFWALHYQRRNEGAEALWRAFPLHGFQSCAHRTANSLKTDAFIYALRRFICRRGPFCQLRSDQGTNFMGARTELAQALAEMDQEKIRTKLLEELCDWISFKMNVPAASHMGGVWEHQIRSARNVLSSLLQKNGRQLDDESLRTLVCEAKAIVDQFLYLVNRARLGFTEHEYLFVHETQPRSRYRARGGRHRARHQLHGTSKRMTASSSITYRAGWHSTSVHPRACMFAGGQKLTSIELENPRMLR